jgi:hypothetical protein
MRLVEQHRIDRHDRHDRHDRRFAAIDAAAFVSTTRPGTESGPCGPFGEPRR